MICPRLLLAVALLTACTHRPPPPSTPNDVMGRPVSFSLPTDEHAVFTIPVPGARTLVLNFFGTPCESCQRTVPDLYRQRATLEAHGSKLLLIAVLEQGQSVADAKRALESWGVKASFLIDEQGIESKKIGVTNVPMTVVLDAQGVAKWVSPPGASVQNIVMEAE